MTDEAVEEALPRDLTNLDNNDLPADKRCDPMDWDTHHWTDQPNPDNPELGGAPWHAIAGAVGEFRTLVCEWCDHPPVTEARRVDPDNPLPVPDPLGPIVAAPETEAAS